ncbi:SPARK domain-containing protein [Heracleum sosnowskyi]|uniref:SPARK domain-containing protein n=1 Tax=Heracleum sosnowskyi TaxID=360622 RepID=A0AAD8N4U6_9APIA|nr:SPARK domain-containing protein [Heracleum sosnowskyi]
MREDLLLVLVLSLCLHDIHCSLNKDAARPDSLEVKSDASSPEVSPKDTQPFLPLLAPSPLLPFINYSNPPALSGLCELNFSAAGTILSTTAVDCWDPLAPYLANVVCCPQLHATVETLIGKSSSSSGKLSLNRTHATSCLSDIGQILESQGASRNIQSMCSMHPSNLTKASCPNIDVNEIERILNYSRLSAACKDVDSVDECCNQVCQNAILDAAEKISLDNRDRVSLDGIDILPAKSSIIDDCRDIVIRWLASKLDLSSSNLFLRGISQCSINRVCPLNFPDIKNVTKECGNTKRNRTACCKAMRSYMSETQEQSFITNLQATNCAALLGKKLQTANISQNVYALCRIKLKDFSLQVGSQDSGCLFPSLPTDVKYDQNTGISFICDLNDNVEASWPTTSSVPASLCNRTATKIPAIPKATSAQSGIDIKGTRYHILVMLFCSLLLNLIS